MVQGALGALLRACGRERGFAGPEWRFEPGAIDRTPTELVPDLAFVAKQRLLDVPAERRFKPPFSPDIAIEIRSPKSDLPYLNEKIERYLATGSVLVLDVDPATRRIRAHTENGTKEYKRGERFEHEAAPWLLFGVDEIFADLDAIENG
jgi:Uma2 family endonuclease